MGRDDLPAVLRRFELGDMVAGGSIDGMDGMIGLVIELDAGGITVQWYNFKHGKDVLRYSKHCTDAIDSWRVVDTR